MGLAHLMCHQSWECRSHFTVLKIDTFSVEGKTISVLDFVGHTVSVTTTQHCCCMKAAVDNM